MVGGSELGVSSEEQETPPELHQDILESILSYVPLIDLLSASQVDKAWNRAVTSSNQRVNRLEPWLVVHSQSNRPPYRTTAKAYDPRWHLWIELKQPPSPMESVSVLRSSQSNLLYMLSPSGLSFSFDPLHLAWHHADAPRVCRMDPIVAVVGRRVVVAGGACDFEDDPLAVEIYDLDSRSWTRRHSMPAVVKDSAALTWISAAADDRRLFVTEKFSGVTHAFDPETDDWHGPYDLRPDRRIFCSAIAIVDDRLILIGLTGDAENVKGLKLWEVNREIFRCEEIGEMPQRLVDKLKGENFQVAAIKACSAENVVYLYNPSDVEEVFVCELVNGGGCRWGSVRNAVVEGRSWAHRVVMTCSSVGIVDVWKALRLDNRRLPVQGDAVVEL